MCFSKNFDPNKKMTFGLTEIPPIMASKMGIKPGFQVHIISEEKGDKGYTASQIVKTVRWKNAHLGYLGVNYHAWPLYKKIGAHLRIFYLWILEHLKIETGFLNKLPHASFHKVVQGRI